MSGQQNRKNETPNSIGKALSYGAASLNKTGASLRSIYRKMPQHKRRRLGLCAVLAAVILVIVLLCCRGDALHRKVIVETDHYEVTAAMFACYFRQNADSYLAAAESNGDLSVYDTARPLSEQEYSSDQTWYDFFMDMTLENVSNQLQLCEAARTAGYSLDAQQAERCKAAAAQEDLSRYQKGVRRKDLEEAVRLTVLAQEYQNTVRAQITVTNEEVSTYYEANKTDYLTASVLSYVFTWNAGEALAGDTAERNAVSGAAENLAACTTQQDFTESVYRYLTESGKMSREEAEEAAANLRVTKFVRDFPQKVQQWLRGGAKRGDTLSVPKEDQGTEAVYFLQSEPDPDNSKAVDFRMIYLTAADFDGVDNALIFAEELREEITAAEDAAAAFSDCAFEYSEDAATYANGGLISGYSSMRTAYGDEAAAWLFDRERQQGDLTVLVHNNAVLLLFFENASEETGWETQVREDLYSRRVAEFMTALAQHEITILDKNFKYLNDTQLNSK